MDSFTLPLATTDDEIELIGGKGRSLARLSRGKINVPNGFHITTTAYRHIVDQHSLQRRIVEAVRPEFKDGAVSFEKAANDVKTLFDEVQIPSELEEQIRSAYESLANGNAAVAVRSSANAEDLPDLSFAGQQETFLNVSGTANVLDAVKQCWASLWTPQALSYRHQNGISPESVAMAVVVQLLVSSGVSGILFTANPATGERSELVINSSFGLGEAVVGGQVTPDTFIVDRESRKATQSVTGSKLLQILPDGSGGTQTIDVPEHRQQDPSLTQAQIEELATIAIEIEQLFEGVPQDIEWAYADGKLNILQSRPITNLPVQPIELEWKVPPPATYVSRRQIVENMPDPICPLFEELYLTEGLESSRKGHSLMVGGGPIFITVNGYAYQRFDFHMVHEQAKEKGLLPVAEEEIEAAQHQAELESLSKVKVRGEKGSDARAMHEQMEAARKKDLEIRERDVQRFRSELDQSDQEEFDIWWNEQDPLNRARQLTMPESKNPTYVAFNNTEWNDRQLGEWFETTRPRLVSIREKWSEVDVSNASDEELLDGIREMGIEEGYYWSSNSSHTFGVAKSTDDQLQCFLRETLPDHQFISGQFLSGIESKTMQANADLFEIAKIVRANEGLSFVVLTTPLKYLMEELKRRNDTGAVLDRIEKYLEEYGHQGYSMDFFVPTQVEDPSALFATLKAMVQDRDYDPQSQNIRATQVRNEKYKEISNLLEGLEYWQFRFRLWLARKYNYIREEVAFLFGYTWSILRPMVSELGQRLVDVGTLEHPEDAYFLVSTELRDAIEARAQHQKRYDLGIVARERRELREALKRHHPPGTLPVEASQIDGIAFKETQIKNDASSDHMRGFPVSSGRVTAPASVVLGPAEFDKMAPGSILVSPLTTPAWTQLFAHAVGLVTDVGSILAHGSIVAREYGIPAVLGVGNGTLRIKHGQMLTIDGDAGVVQIHEENS